MAIEDYTTLDEIKEDLEEIESEPTNKISAVDINEIRSAIKELDGDITSTNESLDSTNQSLTSTNEEVDTKFTEFQATGSATGRPSGVKRYAGGQILLAAGIEGTTLSSFDDIYTGIGTQSADASNLNLKQGGVYKGQVAGTNDITTLLKATIESIALVHNWTEEQKEQVLSVIPEPLTQEEN